MLHKATVILLALLAATVWAQEKAPAPPAPSYEALLAELKGGKTDIDFYALRMAYTATKDYEPYGSADEETRKAMFTALSDKDYAEAQKQAQKALAKDYLDARAHAVAGIAAEHLGDKEQAGFHRAVALGLIRSIFHAGDGHTLETAGEVISTDEEYAYFELAGYRPKDQALVHQGGHSYDKMVVVDSDSQQEVTFYFLIDKPMQHLEDSLKPEKK
jgi:hypothetical protein